MIFFKKEPYNQFLLRRFLLNKKGETLVGLMAALGIFSFLMLALITLLTDVVESGEKFLNPKANDYESSLNVLRKDLTLAYPSFNNIACLISTNRQAPLAALYLAGCNDTVTKNFFKYYDASSYSANLNSDQNTLLNFQLSKFRNLVLLLKDKRFKARSIQVSDLIEYPNPSYAKLLEVISAQFGLEAGDFQFMIFSPHFVNYSTDQNYNLGVPVLRKQPNLIIQKSGNNFKIVAGSAGHFSLIDSQKHYASEPNSYYNSEGSFKEFIKSLPSFGSGSSALYIQRLKIVHYSVSSTGELYRSSLDEFSDFHINANKKLLAERVCHVKLSRRLASTSFNIQFVADPDGSYGCN